jgi:transposase-like protein
MKRICKKKDSKPWSYRRRKLYTEDDVRQAFADVQTGQKSLSEASRHYNIPKTTLWKRLDHLLGIVRGKILSESEEKKND